ncbi:MAG: VanZ family protein [Rhodocyclaceae bacterium]|jgi:VanZ family protein|nr:VanZ family protein [Rhodocyclaceae bacterium]MCE2722485.1 VanZ family protein [Betaproteobacteria bacterium]MCA3026424.1 VanZ family protein [Rhodocyclaceae bacterium]MCA3029259.1 VanZ family protein [Rhodocyclaceae bacterium]MCA3031379.1 VanZ family protein [Rhodocyclaceae bacterium]
MDADLDLHQTVASRFVGWAIFAYVLILVYASLAPFVGWQQPRGITLFDWPRYITYFDVLINVAAYTPLGALVAAQLQHPLKPFVGEIRRWLLIVGIAVAAGFVLSFSLEFLQAFLPGRVSSPLDFLANTAGAALGAVFMLASFGRRVIHLLLVVRRQHFSDAQLTDWGVLLLVLWLIAQLNPAIPFFEAGMLAEQTASVDLTTGGTVTPYDPLFLLPQVVGIALNVAAFAMFVSVLIHSNRSSLPRIVVILAIGFAAKLTMASLLLKTPQLVSSLSPATVIGVTSGLLMHLFFSTLRYRWRAFWAAMFVFAGGVMAKLASVYAALDQALRLFSWPYGQLANFASLTRWINEVWPLAALLLLAVIFVSTKSDST